MLDFFNNIQVKYFRTQIPIIKKAHLKFVCYVFVLVFSWSFGRLRTYPAAHL